MIIDTPPQRPGVPGPVNGHGPRRTVDATALVAAVASLTKTVTDLRDALRTLRADHDALAKLVTEQMAALGTVDDALLPEDPAALPPEFFDSGEEG